MRNYLFLLKNDGFTLIEMIAVLIIFSFLVASFMPRFIDLDANAMNRAINAGISELNGRESLTWYQVKITHSGWENDDPQVWSRLNKNLGDDYTWQEGLSASGGTLKFKEGQHVVLSRQASTTTSPGKWYRP